MSIHRKLTTVCCAAVLALGLAACSSSNDTQMGKPPPPPRTDLTLLFAAAQDASDAAMDAGDVATAAGEAANAGGAGGYDTMSVAGDSSVAMENARAILGAKTKAGQAVMDAQTALVAANQVKMDAEDIDDDHPQKTSLDKAIDAAIVAAVKALEAATDIRDGVVNDAVVGVTLTGGEDADPEGIPRLFANKVGMDIAMALLPNDDGTGDGVRLEQGTAAPDADNVDETLRFVKKDRVGTMWPDIVGDTVKMRIIDTQKATHTKEVDAASIAGMTLSSVQAPTGDGEMEDDGLQVAATYKGIVGTAFCVGSDCVVEGDADGDVRKFTGSWYFTPAAAMEEYYVKGADGAYEEENLFATFGHWLVVNEDGDEWTVHTFAMSNGEAVLYTVANMADLDDSATYNGEAAGMSVYKTDNAAGDGQDINSGRFTAEVTLNAQFATVSRTTAVIGGTIDDFDGGNAANDEWSVTLVEIDLNDGGRVSTGRTVTASDDGGVWTATAYGDDENARPAGVFGTFNAHFLDGHAAGGYATR